MRFTGVVVQQLLSVVKEPSDVNGRRTEVKHQTHEFIRALEQSGFRLGGAHTGCKKKSHTFLWIGYSIGCHGFIKSYVCSPNTSFTVSLKGTSDDSCLTTQEYVESWFSVLVVLNLLLIE